jgi:cystathionine beta-lyase
VTNPLTVLSIEELRERRSVKWRRYGPDVLPLWVAEMDTPLAPPIAAVLAEAVARGDTGYVDPGALPEAFAGFASRRWGWSPDPRRMSVVPDVLHGLQDVLQLVSAPGDGVVVNTPAYPPFFALLAAIDRMVVTSPLGRTDAGGFFLDLERLERDLARPEVTVYLGCNPHNPTGLVLRPDELAAVAAIARRHGVRVLMDEIHAPLTYPGITHTPYATVAGTDSAIVLVSASKAWNLPGLKAALAVAAGGEGWAALSRLAPEVVFGAGLFGVIASEAAWAEGEAWLAALMAGLDRNRAVFADLLARHLPEVGYHPPDATYLAWLDLSRLELGDDPAAALLERAGVALSPGPTFGEEGRGWARLNLATSPAIITEAVQRIAASLNSGRS